jgi:putative tryptophan/tyrosine transport system substrate-binding protein
MRRRDFITLLGGAAAAPLAARAQRPAAMPVIGWLGAGEPGAFADSVAAFRRGLDAGGFVEGKNVAIEYRWAEGQYDRLPAMAAELVRRPVSIIMASGGSFPTHAAMAATATIPIVFTAPSDPAALGLVASLDRPGGNVTGVNFFLGETRTKVVGLLHELVPAATTVGLVLGFGSNAQDVGPIVTEVQTAVRSLGLQVRPFKVATARDVDDMFAAFAQQPVDALMIQSGPLTSSWFKQIAEQAARLSLPTISQPRAFAEAGGLMSYGTSVTDAYRQAGLYAGRILKGEKPADLPVVQSTKFDLVVNLKTAKALGLAVPPTLLAIADEVIE